MADYSNALEMTDTSILTAMNWYESEGIDAISHLSDIHPLVWTLLVICVSIIALLNTSLAFDRYCHNSIKCFLYNCISYIYLGWNILTLQKLNYNSTQLISLPFANRLLLSLLYICICFIVYSFNSSLSASVIISVKSTVIDSLEDLVNNPNVRPAFMRGTAHANWFTSDDINLINRRILNTSLLFNGSDIYTDVVLKPLTQYKIALISGTENLQTTAINSCEKYPYSTLYIAKKSFNSNINGYALRKSLDLRVKLKIKHKYSIINTFDLLK